MRFVLHLHPKFVGLPDKLDIEPSNRLQMPSNIHPIPFPTTTLSDYATPKANTLMSLFLVLFSLIFNASKAQVARSNRAGQATYLPFIVILGLFQAA